MTNRMLKIVAVVGLVVFVFTTWHIAQAKEEQIKKSDLPKGVLARIKRDFSKATIVKAGVEDDEEYSVKVYEVKFRVKGQEREVMFSPAPSRGPSPRWPRVGRYTRSRGQSFSRSSSSSS